MLLHHLEYIDLEWEQQHLTKKALRIDDKKNGKQGIRGQLGLNSYNCCDYLYPWRNQIYFIELSDLSSQLVKLQEQWQFLPPECQKHLKKAKKNIRDEIRLKIISSLLILFRIPTQFTIKHSKIHQKTFNLILILRGDHDDVKAFDYLKDDLENALKPLITEVKVMNPDMFVKDFKF